MRDIKRNCCYLSPLKPALITYGMRGKNPKMINEIRVTTPFQNGEESSTTNPNYSSIIMLTKACVFVEYKSAMRLYKLNKLL